MNEKLKTLLTMNHKIQELVRNADSLDELIAYQKVLSIITNEIIKLK